MEIVDVGLCGIGDDEVVDVFEEVVVVVVG